MELCVGIIFKKRKINYKNEAMEIYEYKGIASAIKFVNTEHITRYNILNGDLYGKYLESLNGSEDEVVFYEQPLNEWIKQNDNNVDWNKINENANKNFEKYYINNGYGKGLRAITERKFIEFLDEENKKSFKEINNDTDISKMYQLIKKTIISQDEQIMQILTSLYKNKKVVESCLDPDLISKLKENILIYGPTGTGKTEIIKRIAKSYKLPMVIEDATSLSEVGYQGRNVTDMLKDLYLEAGSDIQKAEKGILVIDEFDKLAEKSEDGQTHVSRSGVQRSLLKLLDGSTLYVDNMEFDTSKLTIICIGAFTDIKKEADYKDLKMEDFISYGIMKELMGRFSKTVAMNSLSKKDIKQILTESNFSPLKTYKSLFETMDIKFSFDDSFVDYVSEKAVALDSGARSLKTIVDNEISGAMFDIFAGNYSAINLSKPKYVDDDAYTLTKSKEKKKFFAKKS